MILIFCVAGIECAVAAPASPPTVCHPSGIYLVIARERPDQTGSNFLIRRTNDAQSGAPCTFSYKLGDLRVPASPELENAWYFLALLGERMALDAGTASQHRKLIIVDLPTGRIVKEFYTFREAQVRNGTAYITIPGRRGTRSICPDIEESLIGNTRLISEIAVNLKTLASSPAGGMKCVYEE
ncbi:hypothetical protein R1A27_04735 [Methylobacterium sp. NMS12]|uniref:hypothetical protein n=1 Tax=Methylobacterium sp. NMS12 TaxID=3079766 RepID=UPI003F880949